MSASFRALLLSVVVIIIITVIVIIIRCLKSQYKQLRVQGLVENNQVMILETPS